MTHNDDLSDISFFIHLLIHYTVPPFLTTRLDSRTGTARRAGKLPVSRLDNLRWPKNHDKINARLRAAEGGARWGTIFERWGMGKEK